MNEDWPIPIRSTKSEEGANFDARQNFRCGRD